MAWARGGFLGVSAFFTLSGFLITSIVLRASPDGRGGLTAFWSRRVRRLLPVAFVGVVVAAAFAVAAAGAVTLERFPGDAVAAILGVANWRYVLDDLSYADLFAGASPLQHYWSLAIEQQFYLVFPVVAAWALRPRTRDTDGAGGRRLFFAVAVGLVASVVVSSLVGTDRAYYGTDTRMAELLVGAMLALIHDRRPISERLPTRASGTLGVLALVTMVVLWSTVEQTTGWLHPWLLLVHALLTALVIAAATAPTPLGRLLSVPALAGLGRISYAVYVLHWPVFLWLTPQRVAIDGWALAALRISVTLAASILVHHVVEEPARRRHDVGGGRLVRVTAVAALATVALAVLPATVVDRQPAIDFEAAEALQAEVMTRAAPSPPITSPASEPRSRASEATDPAPGVTSLPERPVVSVFGDSTALFLLPGLDAWAGRTGDAFLAGGSTTKGCGIVRGEVELADGSIVATRPECAYDLQWPGVLEAAGTDIAVVSIGLWDLVDFRIPGDTAGRAFGDPVFDAYFRSEVESAVEVLLTTADRVVWLIQPRPVGGTRGDGDPIHERLPILNELVSKALADHPDASVVDLAAWLESTPDGTDSTRLRPDGTHFSATTSVEVADWLGPAILDAATGRDRVDAESNRPRRLPD